MKIQIRDRESWALLAETSLANKIFTVVGDKFVCKEEITMRVIANGTAMPIAFLVTDAGKFIRVINLDMSTASLRDGNDITIPVGAFTWG